MIRGAHHDVLTAAPTEAFPTSEPHPSGPWSPTGRQPRPYVWHKAADETLDSLTRHVQRIPNSGHQARVQPGKLHRSSRVAPRLHRSRDVLALDRWRFTGTMRERWRLHRSRCRSERHLRHHEGGPRRRSHHAVVACCLREDACPGRASAPPTTTAAAAAERPQAPSASAAVGVSAVVDVEHPDGSGRVVDEVAHAVLAAPRPPVALERRTKGCSNAARCCDESPRDELPCSKGCAGR